MADQHQVMLIRNEAHIGFHSQDEVSHGYTADSDLQSMFNVLGGLSVECHFSHRSNPVWAAASTNRGVGPLGNSSGTPSKTSQQDLSTSPSKPTQFSGWCPSGSVHVWA